jgi:predicted nucleic acid-binding protein
LISRDPLIVDTCVLINLLASDHIEDIFRQAAPTLLVCSAVSAETLYLRPLDPNSQPELIDLKPFFTKGFLKQCDCSSDEEKQLYVDYASELDDGEAMSLAIAQARNFPLATDEKKTRKIIRRDIKHLRVISTAEILNFWASGADIAEVRRALRAIEIRARFSPPKDDPLLTWWNSI